jgi:hypothetical protein
VETTVYGEIVKIKQDRMIPVFRCVVIENHCIAVLWHVFRGWCQKIHPLPGA